MTREEMTDFIEGLRAQGVLKVTFEDVFYNDESYTEVGDVVCREGVSPENVDVSEVDLYQLADDFGYGTGYTHELDVERGVLRVTGEVWIPEPENTYERYDEPIEKPLVDEEAAA